jgi:DNA-binding transcriptional LysR family regulator
MKQLSLDILRTLVTIVDVGNFNKAGELLGRSQPAISLQIKKLEGQINRKLFNKVGQSYQINNDGKWLYAKAKQMLAINDEVFRELSHETLRGRLRLGIPSEFASVLLPSIIGEFSKRYPDVSLDVTSLLSKHLLSSDQSGQFDLILALIPEASDIQSLSNDSANKVEVIRKDRLIWVGSPNHNLQADALHLVLAPEGCVYRSRVINMLKQQTQPWKITYTNPDFFGLMTAINHDLGITALAHSIVPADLDVIKDKRLPKLGKINICLINRDSQHPQVSQTLADYIRARITK